MNEKIEKFKNMNLKEQKKILLIILSKSVNKSEWIRDLHFTVENTDISLELEVIRIEFIKIYKFLMEAVDYIKSNQLKESFTKLDTINKTLNEMRDKEKEERESEIWDYDLDKELNNL